MKMVLLALLWCTVVFLSLLTLYKFVPPETQYSFAEHFEIYGDELIMDFVLYLFLGIAILRQCPRWFFICSYGKDNPGQQCCPSSRFILKKVI